MVLKAGGAASSNSDGSIPSSVSANQTYGFSVVRYTGTGSNGTVGHGLNSAPAFFFGRNLEDTSTSLDWVVYHQSVGNTGRLKLNSNSSTSTSSTFFQDTSPSSSVFSIGTSNDINKDDDDYVMYCWSEIPGFSKFGSFSGTASSGNKVTTGFKPKFVLIKRVGNGSDGDTNYGGWGMYQEGQTDEQLMANCSGEEGVRGIATLVLTHVTFKPMLYLTTTGLLLVVLGMNRMILACNTSTQLLLTNHRVRSLIA